MDSVDHHLLLRDSTLSGFGYNNRYIVFTICVSDNLINEENGNQQVTALFDALIACVEKFNVNNHVCFNIANSSLKLFNDR